MPSDEVLEREGIALSKETAMKVALIRKLVPRRIEIRPVDLRRLKAVGRGKWKDGFYRVLALAHYCWLQEDDLNRLIALGNGNARAGLVYAMNIAEETKKCQKPQTEKNS